MTSEGAEVATAHAILRSLDSRRRHDRSSRIVKTYSQTGNWVFDPEVVNLITWLESGSGVFWVCGKAGSGKSTMMKHIDNHPKTEEMLRKWASQSHHLVTASFYMWALSVDPMQRTQTGLFQSLLFQFLRQRPEMIRNASPRRWHSDEYSLLHPDPWTMDELLDALVTVLAQTTESVKCCFFIDGLDEYTVDVNDLTGPRDRAQGIVENTGDLHDLTKNIEKLSQWPHVKFCVSSRPWTEFKKAFDHDKQSLTMEILTKPDIEAYVRGNLEEDSRYSKLATSDVRARELVTQIREKAQGVFLWVFLVVRSLLRGLSKFDNIQTLQQRVEEFPSELESYYETILTNVEKIYRPLTMRLLQLALYAGAMPLITFHVLPLEIEDPEYAFNETVEPPEEAESRELVSDGSHRVNAWCRDLLEVHRVTLDGEKDAQHGNELLRHQIVFLHRTVPDFLRTPTMQNQIQAELGSNFDPFISLSRVMLVQAKMINAQDANCEELVRQTGRLTFKYAFQYERESGRTPFRLVVAIDKQLQSIWETKLKSHWSDLDAKANNLLAMGVWWDVDKFVDEYLSQHPKEINKVGTTLLGYVFHSGRRVPFSTEMIHVLLKHGANPNQATNGIGSLSAWELLLNICNTQGDHGLWPIVQLMLEHGANPDVVVPLGGDQLKLPFGSPGRITGGRETKLNQATVEVCLRHHEASEVAEVLGRARARQKRWWQLLWP